VFYILKTDKICYGFIIINQKIEYKMRQVTLVFLLCVSLFSSGYRFRCFLFCHEQTGVQNNYVENQADCQDYAQAKLDDAMSSEVNPDSEKGQQAKLVSLFSDCMAKKGWDVPSGNKKIASKDDSFPAITTPSAVKKQADASTNDTTIVAADSSVANTANNAANSAQVNSQPSITKKTEDTGNTLTTPATQQNPQTANVQQQPQVIRKQFAQETVKNNEVAVAQQAQQKVQPKNNQEQVSASQVSQEQPQQQFVQKQQNIPAPVQQQQPTQQQPTSYQAQPAQQQQPAAPTVIPATQVEQPNNIPAQPQPTVKAKPLEASAPKATPAQQSQNFLTANDNNSGQIQANVDSPIPSNIKTETAKTPSPQQQFVQPQQQITQPLQQQAQASNNGVSANAIDQPNNINLQPESTINSKASQIVKPSNAQPKNVLRLPEEQEQISQRNSVEKPIITRKSPIKTQAQEKAIPQPSTQAAAPVQAVETKALDAPQSVASPTNVAPQVASPQANVAQVTPPIPTLPQPPITQGQGAKAIEIPQSVNPQPQTTAQKVAVNSAKQGDTKKSAECAFARTSAKISSAAAAKAEECDLECADALKLGSKIYPVACPPDVIPKKK
jgi:hypothetical protein